MFPEKKLDEKESVLHIDDKSDFDVASGELPTIVENTIDDLPSTWYIWLVSITASIAGLLFGYNTGIISAVLVYLHNDLNGRPTASSEKEMITSLCSAGAFIGAVIAGLTADKYGRKIAIYVGCCLFTVGAVIQGTSYTIGQMVAGRLIVGFGVGSAAMIVPLYIAEIAPNKVRGRLIGLNNVSITGGQVISYGIGAGFAHVPHGWRYMVGLGGVPSVILACLLPFCPESPRQLIFHGRSTEAGDVLKKIYKGTSDDQVKAKIADIEAACEESKELNSASRWTKIKQLHTIPSNFRALLSACGLMVISQMSGFNTLMYYSGTLFDMVDFSNEPVAVGTTVASANFIMTLANMVLVDPIGRRKLLLSTVWGMSAGLLAVAVAFSFIPIDR